MAERDKKSGLIATRREDTPQVVALSQVPDQERQTLLRGYHREVNAPAFPDASLREDPDYWLRLLAERPSPPQPLIDVLLLLDEGGDPLGGATVELYRTAGCGLLTYIAVHGEHRGRGLGRNLVARARDSLTRMAGAPASMFAET